MPKKKVVSVKSPYNVTLFNFVTESNAIEGIMRTPTDVELEAHLTLLNMSVVNVSLLCQFVGLIAPGAELRDVVGRDVYVGNHVPPPGGAEVRYKLEALLKKMDKEQTQTDIWQCHIDYETLHPFMDGNGRSGRALWARSMYQMFGWTGLNLLFLHRFYYQTLSGVRHGS